MGACARLIRQIRIRMLYLEAERLRLEKVLLEDAIREPTANDAAKRFGTSRARFYRLLRKHGLERKAS